MCDVLKNGGHGLIFSSEFKFGLWHKQLRKVKDTVEESGDEHYAVAAARTFPVFEAENVAQKHSRTPVHYIWSPSFMRLFHTNVSESAVQFWTLGLWRNSLLRKVEYGAGDGRNTRESRVDHEDAFCWLVAA